MEYVNRRLAKSELVSEIIFDFKSEKTKVVDDKIFLKIKETTVPIEVGSNITFTKTLYYSQDMSFKKKSQTFEVLSVKDDVIEIANPPINKLWLLDAVEYSKYDADIDEGDEEEKTFNYLPTDFSDEFHYFIMEFENEHYIAENEKNFSIRAKRRSNWALNGYIHLESYNDFKNLTEGIKETLYLIKYGKIVRDTTEPDNIIKYWKTDDDGNNGTFYPSGDDVSLSDEEVSKLLKDLEIDRWYSTTESSKQSYFYKHFNKFIDDKILQLVVKREDFLDNEWGYRIGESEFDIVYSIDGEEYDDRIFFKECGEKIILSNNVSATTASKYLDFKVHMNQAQGTNLFQENLLRQEYVDDTIRSSIPEINDYEKNIIKPYIQREEGKFEKASRIVFNLHFRNRMVKKDNENEETISETWSTDDTKYWNGYDPNDIDEFKIDKSDLLYYLGFEEDDVYFQKMKLQKSFLRLSFYDSNDPMNQNLLFYSTVFMDTGELFGTYNKLKTQVINGEISGYDSNSNVLEIDKEGFDSITSQFIVTDKFNTNKCSEGFYLYLFNKTLPKKVEEPIYMKVEFNHAKYGKTIPFLYFTNRDKTPSDTPKRRYIDIVNGQTSVDMESYFTDLHIEMRVKYDEETRSYIYYLPYDNTTESTDIVLNLFEPKINGDEE